MQRKTTIGASIEEEPIEKAVEADAREKSGQAAEAYANRHSQPAE